MHKALPASGARVYVSFASKNSHDNWNSVKKIKQGGLVGISLVKQLVNTLSRF